jgi:hypothetical protein
MEVIYNPFSNIKPTQKLFTTSPLNGNSKNNCIICLQIDNNIIKHEGTCNCNFYVHTKCLDEWYSNKPKKCIICRKGIIETQVKQSIPENQHNQNDSACGLCCCMYLCSLFCMSVSGVLH